MNSIPNTPMVRAVSPDPGALQDYYAAEFFEKKQSLSYQENLNAGLTIKTKEGDLVTLNTSSFAKMDAFQYDSKGVLQSENGTVEGSVNHRQMTLATGEYFSFSVVGDLSEDELADIEQIIAGIDGIIVEISQGDMEGAVEKALEMDGYDTVSMFAADISLQRSYSAQTSITERQMSGNLPNSPYLNGSGHIPAAYMQPAFDADMPEKVEYKKMARFEEMIQQMTQQLEKHSEKQVSRSRKAVDKLFNHYLKKHEFQGSEQTPAYRGIQNASKHINQYMDRISKMLFGEQFA